MNNWIRRTNQAYDDLATTRPLLRFGLFVTPLSVAGVLDVVIKLWTWPDSQDYGIMLMVALVMAAWRFWYMLLPKRD